ncbi:MAG TPA: fibronectin type III domain-containing protein, partial [Armatimonadota bacterium]
MSVRLPTHGYSPCRRAVWPQALFLLVWLPLAALFQCPTASATVQSWRVNLGALSEDPGVAEPQLTGVSIGTQEGAQDGPAAGEDAPGLPSGAPPYVSLSIVHPGDPQWAMISAPDGASLSDIRSPLSPGASQTWRLRVTGDNGSALLQGPRYLVLIWYLQDVPDEIELTLRRGDNPGLPGIDVKKVVNLTLTQTAPLQHFEFLLTARNKQVGVVCTSPPRATPSDTSALVQWTTDRPSSSRVEYGATQQYGQMAGSGALATDHAVLVSGLAPLTAYHFRVTSDALAPPVVPYVSPDFTFATEATPLLILNPRVTDLGERSAIVRWSTRVPASSRVDLGQGLPLGMGLEDTQLTLEHAVELSDLAPRTAYLVRAVSQVPGSSYGESAVLSFATPPAVQVTDGPGVLEGGDNAEVTWSTDQAATSHVEYGPLEGPGFVTDESSLTTRHTVRLSSLAPDTGYWFRVSSTAPGFAPYESQQLSFATHGEPVRFLEEPGATDLGPRS